MKTGTKMKKYLDLKDILQAFVIRESGIPVLKHNLTLDGGVPVQLYQSDGSNRLYKSGG